MLYNTLLVEIVMDIATMKRDLAARRRSTKYMHMISKKQPEVLPFVALEGSFREGIRHRNG